MSQGLLRHLIGCVESNDPVLFESYLPLVPDINELVSKSSVAPISPTVHSAKFSVLHHIVESNACIEIFQSLMTRQDIDVNIKNSEFETPLAIAIIRDHTYYVKQLALHPKIDVNEAFITAVYRKKWEAARYLLTLPNLNINYQDNGGAHILHFVVSYASPDIINAVLKHPNIDINAQTIQWERFGLYDLLLRPGEFYESIVLALLERADTDVYLTERYGYSIFSSPRIPIRRRVWVWTWLIGKHVRDHALARLVAMYCALAYSEEQDDELLRDMASIMNVPLEMNVDKADIHDLLDMGGEWDAEGFAEMKKRREKKRERVAEIMLGARKRVCLLMGANWHPTDAS